MSKLFTDRAFLHLLYIELGSRISVGKLSIKLASYCSVKLSLLRYFLKSIVLLNWTEFEDLVFSPVSLVVYDSNLKRFSNFSLANRLSIRAFCLLKSRKPLPSTLVRLEHWERALCDLVSSYC